MAAGTRVAGDPLLLLFLLLILLLPFLLLPPAVLAGKERPPEKEGDERSPFFFFGEESFDRRSDSPLGRFDVLRRFSDMSPELRGSPFDDHRFAILEAEPMSFAMPSHWDAEEALYVINGEGIVTWVLGEDRESYEIRKGDVLCVPAGAIVYLVNNGRHERLRIALLLRSISIPGEFQEFLVAGGGEKTESFFRSFSDGVLEAAFNTPRDKIEKLFGRKQRKKGEGVFKKATEHQIEALSRRPERGGGRWPFGLSRRPYNLLEKEPLHSNRHGKLYEVGPADYRHLRDLGVSFAAISNGSMMAPFYSSRAANVALVVAGEVFMEVVGPDVPMEKKVKEKEKKKGKKKKKHEMGGDDERHNVSSGGYKRFEARLSTGSAFVLPAGYPVAVTIAGEDDAEILWFGVGVAGDRKNFLSGKNNVMKQMEREAKELVFDAPASEVEEVFDVQEDSVFLRGPEMPGGGGEPLRSAYV